MEFDKKLANKSVVYFSDKDNCWISHSLHTDQIGTGDSPIEALNDMMCAIIQLIDLARNDETLAVWQESPIQVEFNGLDE